MTYKSADTWSNEMLHRFSTKIFDTGGTGLYDYGYRFYDTVAGRWLKRDPIEERGGLNLYSYVENDGANHIDQLGMAALMLGEDNFLSTHRNDTLPPEPGSEFDDEPWNDAMPIARNDDPCDPSRGCSDSQLPAGCFADVKQLLAPNQ